MSERIAGAAKAKRSTLHAPVRRAALLVLSVGALGVVFGDIGTSPLYALRECFHGAYAIAATHDNVLGVLSLILWALIVIVSVKYLVFVLRADNRGEGGILALMALVHPRHEPSPLQSAIARRVLVMLGLFGACLLYGDGMITPAISVLSAVEGLNVATTAFEPLVIPVTVGILVGLFLVQRHGTARVGAIFGPIMIVWFAVLAALGIRGIAAHPTVLAAANPWYAVRFFMTNGVPGFLVLGAVFLVVTGGEALYADMGHFGARPIRLAWFTLVLPALVLNYFGQGGLLLADPTANENPFYLLAPHWALYPLVALSTMATIIASQAVISGAFSLTMQAIHLGYSPRMEIRHTSETEKGQIYIPEINWLLMFATVGLVLGFRTSSALAGAYGVAVATTMTITTVLLFVAARKVWRWKLLPSLALLVFFLALDALFFGANIVKIAEGGWFPLVIAGVAFTLMTTWRKGRQILGERMRAGRMTVETFAERMRMRPPMRVPGTAVFLTSDAYAAPIALIHNVRHNKIVHENVAILSVQVEEVSRVPASERLRVEEIAPGFHRLVARYGFMEDPDVPALLRLARLQGFAHDPNDTTYFLGRERLIVTRAPGGMAFWRERLFAFMARNAQQATAFFRIPPERVVEVGAQVRL